MELGKEHMLCEPKYDIESDLRYAEILKPDAEVRD